MLLTPCHKLSHLLGPLPLERDVIYGRPLSNNTATVTYSDAEIFNQDNDCHDDIFQRLGRLESLNGFIYNMNGDII